MNALYTFTNENYFTKTCEPMRVWLWFVYKITKTNCRSRLFAEFIHTQKRYPTSFDKVSVLT